MNIDDLKHLAELERAATPGLWHWDGTFSVFRAGPIGDRGRSTITVGATCHECGVDDECEVWFNSEADKTLLLALRNHAAELIAMVQESETWFDAMYRIIDALGGQRGMSVPEDIEHAVARAKELVDAVSVAMACERFGVTATPDFGDPGRWSPVFGEDSEFHDSFWKEYPKPFATFADAVLAAAAWLEARKT